MTTKIPDETVSAKEVATFYSHLINQLSQCDRALVTAFLDSPALTQEQRAAIETWSASVELIVESAMAYIETGTPPH